MHVLHTLSGLDPRAGGPANALAGLAIAQADAGLEVSVLATWKPGWDQTLADRIRADNRITLNLVGPIGGWRKTHPHVRRVALQAVAKADVVHIHALWESIQHAASRAARQLRKPVIFRPCGMLDPWSMDQGGWKKRAYLNFILRRELNSARLIHYTTQSEADLAARWNIKAPPIIMPNGLNLPEFRELPPRGAFRAQHDIAPDTPIVLFMSRVHPKKGLDLLIPAFAKATADEPAFAKATDDNPAPILVIAGPSYLDTEQQMQRLAEQCSVADRVLFVGMLTGADRVHALVDADLFVLPSRQENFGIVVVEAMAAARPVIVSDQVNLHQDITAAGAGDVVPLEVPAIASALSKWLADEPLRRETGNLGRAHALAVWDWNAIARRWADQYQQLTERV